MPYKFSAQCTVHSAKSKKRTYHFREKPGFSLIELMVVISLFGIAASLITASYLSFERNQRVKTASSQFKSDLRLVQNSAHSGDKNPAGVGCASGSTLGGWYLEIMKNALSYSLGGDCIIGSVEHSFSVRTVSLPKDTIVNKIFYVSAPDVTYPLAIFFQPLTSGVSFHEGDFAVAPDGSLDFLDNATGVLKNLVNPQPSSLVTIQFSNTAGNKCYQVVIGLTGEVNENNPGACQ